MKFLLIALFVFPLVFRNALVTILGGVGQVLSLIPLGVAAVLFVYSLIINQRVNRSYIPALIFCCYCVASIIFFPYLTIEENMMTPFFGFFQLALPIILVLFLSDKKYNYNEYVNVIMYTIIVVSLTNAIGGIIQFYFSPNLFGLISNTVYDGVITYENVSKRAISFFASPQSLSILLGFSLPILWNSPLSKLNKVCFTAIILFCGVLTGSKAFFIYLFFYFLLSIELRSAFLILVAVIVLASISNTGIEQVDRILEIKNKILELSSYHTFQIWMDFLTYPSSLMQVLFGHGLGVISTSSQKIYEYAILNGSAESFFIQVYFEIGIVGVLLFIIMFFGPLINVIRIKKTKHIGIALLSITASMAFTPAFYGFGMSVIVYLLYSVAIESGIYGNDENV